MSIKEIKEIVFSSQDEVAKFIAEYESGSHAELKSVYECLQKFKANGKEIEVKYERIVFTTQAEVEKFIAEYENGCHAELINSKLVERQFTQLMNIINEVKAKKLNA